MAVKDMQKLYVYAWKSCGDALLELLRQKGTVQIRMGDPEDAFFKKTDTKALEADFSKKAADVSGALKILDQWAPEKTSVFDALKGKRELSQKAYGRLADKEPHIALVARELKKYQQALDDIKATRLRIQMEQESLKPWMAADIPVHDQGTRYTALLFGTLPGAWDEAQVRQLLKDLSNGVEVEIIDQDPGQTCLVVLCLLKRQGQIEDALRKKGFVRAAFDFSETPSRHMEGLKESLETCDRQETEICSAIRRLWGERENLRFLEDYYTASAEKYKMLGQLLQSSHVIYLSGYTPKDGAVKLQQLLESRFNCVAQLEDIPLDEPVPVLLSNSAFAGPTQNVVESYGLPGRKEVDPTSIMAFFYYFFFGLMLSDAGYGILMVAGCFLFLKKYPKMPKGIKDMLTMFLYCGISTTFWGIMFGGYFGDVIPVVAQAFFHKEVTVPALWFAPLDDPMKLLVFSFLFGIIHLFAGLAIKGFLLIREKKYMDCLCEVVFWYMLLIGLILMLLPSDIFVSMAGTALVFPGWVVSLSQILAVVGAVGILFMAGRHRKNFGIRLALGAYELYGVTSWLSDVLSYSRLLALGIATGVIASVINTMGTMMGDGILGIIAFIVIFLLGHTLNLAINLLGAYVHTNRLQYVEFFGKFYEGDGEAFRPFSDASNKYIKVKEED